MTGNLCDDLLEIPWSHWQPNQISRFLVSRATFPVYIEPANPGGSLEMPEKKEKACKQEFERDLSDSNTPIYFSSLAFLGPVFADETYKQTQGGSVGEGE